MHLIGRRAYGGLGSALVGHVGELNAGLHGEQSHGNVLRAAVAARAVIDFAGRFAGCFDQFGRRFEGRIGGHDQRPFDGGDQRDRLKIFENVPRHFAVKTRQHGHDAVVETTQRVTIGRGLGDALGANQTCGPNLVVDGDAHAHIGRHFLRDDARGAVHRTARRQRDDHFDGLVRVGALRPRVGHQQARGGAQARLNDKASLHVCLRFQEGV